MTAHRTKPLPVAPSRGKLVVAEQVVASTKRLLAAAGSRTPPHEGLVFWLGRCAGTDTYVLAALAPTVDSGPQRVIAGEASVGNASAAARACRLAVVAQAHSHPGRDTRHSDGDDTLVLMPFEGMFSLVIADYGAGDVSPSGGAGLHQFQDHQWVQVSDPTFTLIVIPDEVKQP
jgi:hypothetical protein